MTTTGPWNVGTTTEMPGRRTPRSLRACIWAAATTAPVLPADRTASRNRPLRNRSGTDRTPFLLVASFLQPHDVCQFVAMHTKGNEMPFYEQVADELPPLPPNFQYDANEPASLKRRKRPAWSEDMWRYYIWSYYRMVEMVDHEIGRIYDAVRNGPHADNSAINKEGFPARAMAIMIRCLCPPLN